jgi:voltage-gated potassium channel Kch
MFAIVAVLRRFVRTVREAWQHHEFRGLLFLVVLTLATGTVVYSLVEGWSLLNAFYFSVITLTTVGFGHFSPTTAGGKIFTAFYIFVGVAIILTFIDTMGEISLRRRGIRRDRGYRPPEDTER